MRRFNFGSAIFASIVACIIMTAFMMYFKMNIMVQLGQLAGMTSKAAIYFIGGVIHLIVAIVFGLIYALIFQPLMHKFPGFLSGTIYSLLPFILAMTLMGQFTGLIKTVFKNNDCSPTQMSCSPTTPMVDPAEKSSDLDNVGPSVPAKECSPSYDNNSAKDKAYSNSPTCSADYPEDCSPESNIDENPISPQCRPDSMSPTAKLEARAPIARDFKLIGQDDAMCHPKAKSVNGEMKPETSAKVKRSVSSKVDSMKEEAESNLPAWVWSLINHVVYGFFLGLVYSPRKRRHLGE
ncbi:MAG: hypothetical protein P0S95_06930 [Rhabdochlamydiaceae bacterium]|nr:hypothetical protein [Candidatus Amphrikana amoebophyrae]